MHQGKGCREEMVGKKSKYENFTDGDHTFVFKYDDKFPDFLHIWVNHTKTMEEAADVFFEGEDLGWDDWRKVEVTKWGNTTLWWYWIDEQKKVLMVVSCFNDS
jgi:hypothetical protein